MNTLAEKSVGEIVTADFRTAAVFEKFGIDFCCKGSLSIEDACAKKRIQPDSLLKGIEDILSAPSHTTDFKSWPMDLLADYIEKIHHQYVVDKSTLIVQYLQKLTKVHGGQHKELYEIYELFEGCAHAMSAHMRKEELVLFPYIRKLQAALQSNEALPPAHFGTVNNPVQMMKEEHTFEGERFAKISELSNNYTPPADACNTYKVTFAMLKEFEEDLHLHIHLENNILFPRAIEAEAQLKHHK